jgi:hypothetical protein
MNTKIIWSILLIGFLGVNGYALLTAESGDFARYLSNLGPWGILASVDLILALTIAVSWMWADARKKGINPIPYTILTVCTGSVGLLLYLVRFTGNRSAKQTSPAEKHIAT